MVLLDLKGRWAVGDARNRSVALQAVDDLRANYHWLEEVLLKEKARDSCSQRGTQDNPWIESLWGRFETVNGELILETETE